MSRSKKKSLRKLFLKLKVPECWIWIWKSVWHWPKRLVYLAFTHHNTHHQFDPLNLITLVKVLALNHAVTVFWQCLDLYWPMRRSFLTHHVCRIDGRRNASDHFWVLIQHELERTTSSLNRVQPGMDATHYVCAAQYIALLKMTKCEQVNKARRLENGLQQCQGCVKWWEVQIF